MKTVTKFNEWLNMNKKKNLAVFDIDGTLLSVPEKPTNDQEKENYGWNGKDWWGSECSLSKDVYPHDEVVDALKKAKSDPDTRAIILTGRRPKVSHKLREIFRSLGLYGKRMFGKNNKESVKFFKKSISSKQDIQHEKENDLDAHEEYYTGDFNLDEDYPDVKQFTGFSAATKAHKQHVIMKCITKQTKNIDIWEDRADHIPFFKKLADDIKKKFPKIKITFHHVHEPATVGGQPNISHYEI